MLVTGGPANVEAVGGILLGYIGGPGGTTAGSQLAGFGREWIVMFCTPAIVALLLIVNVPAPIEVTVVLTGIPGPVMVIPTARPAVEETAVTVLLPMASVPVMVALAVPVHWPRASVETKPKARSSVPKHARDRNVERRMAVRVIGSIRWPKVGL